MSDRDGLRAWAVSDRGHEVQIAVIALSRSRAKMLALGRYFDHEDYIDLRCIRIHSPIPLPDRERIIEDTQESLWYGFRWNDDTMAWAFGDEWYGCWLREVDAGIEHPPEPDDLSEYALLDYY